MSSRPVTCGGHDGTGCASANGRPCWVFLSDLKENKNDADWVTNGKTCVKCGHHISDHYDPVSEGNTQDVLQNQLRDLKLSQKKTEEKVTSIKKEMVEKVTSIQKSMLSEMPPISSTTRAEYFKLVVCNNDSRTPDKITLPNSEEQLSSDCEDVWKGKPESFSSEDKVQDFFSDLFTKMEIGFIDTHSNPYLDGCKPDGSFLAGSAVLPHPSNVACFLELKLQTTSNGFTKSDMGQAFKYHEAPLRDQMWCQRYQISTILATGTHMQVVRTMVENKERKYFATDIFAITLESLRKVKALIREERDMVKLHRFTACFDGTTAQYIATDLLGQGKSAWVFACQTTAGENAGVLKVAKDAKYNPAILREAKILRDVLVACPTTPHVFGEDLDINGVSGFLMYERLCAPSKRRPGLGLCIEDVEDIAEALWYLHRAGYVHCDVDVRNMMIQFPEDMANQDSSPRAYLIDFGFVRRVGTRHPYSGTRTTASNNVLQALVNKGRESHIVMTPHDDLVSLWRSVYLYVLDRPILIKGESETGAEKVKWPSTVNAWWAPRLKVPTSPKAALSSLEDLSAGAESYRAYGKEIAIYLALPSRVEERTDTVWHRPGRSPDGSPAKDDLDGTGPEVKGSGMGNSGDSKRAAHTLAFSSPRKS